MAGDSNRNLVFLVVFLVVALVVVLFMWQRDQESKDVDIDIGTGESASVQAVPELVAAAGFRSSAGLS